MNATGTRRRGTVLAPLLSTSFLVATLSAAAATTVSGQGVSGQEGAGKARSATAGVPGTREKEEPLAAGARARESLRRGAGGALAERGLGPRVSLTARTEKAVERGLAYLARNQNADGSWTDRVGRKVYTTYRGREAPHVGVTALAGMAFLSAGIVPSGGPGEYLDRYGRKRPGYEFVEKAIDYLVSKTEPTGYITDNGSRMYSHAFAALFLAEAYGMGYHGGGKLKAALKRSITMIESSQNDEGGWRYKPNSPDSDMSVTVCQVMALRAARNAGISVRKETIDNAVLYVRRSFLPVIGAFTYQLGPEFRGVPSRHSFALTAAGVATLYGAGEYNATNVINQAVRYMWINRPRSSRASQKFDYYYGQYYAVQAMFQKGGEDWKHWYEDYIQPDLLELQGPDGSWTDLVGTNYGTAMAAIILQFPNQYLPITEN